MVSTIEPLANKRHNRLLVNSTVDRKYVEIDALKLKQILINLLGNACKFTDNGKISLTINENHAGGNSQKYLTFHVEDTGIGIRPETLRVLFQPFTQEEQNYIRHYSGTGLGLSISKRLCELMGGTIKVSSKHGKGSHFTVNIPIVEQQHGKQLIHIDNPLSFDKASNQ